MRRSPSRSWTSWRTSAQPTSSKPWTPTTLRTCSATYQRGRGSDSLHSWNLTRLTTFGACSSDDGPPPKALAAGCVVNTDCDAPLVCAQIASAQEPPPVRIRGTIERVDGAIYVVKARDGAELKLTLADNPQIAGIIKASLSDIKKGSFVGVTAMPQADGSLSALEVHIFPEAMRGTGEGHYPWDLQPKSTMTNANVQ